MKTKDHEPLVTDNLKRLQSSIKAGSGIGDYEGILACLADALDSAANGSECYCVIGLSRNRDQAMMTITIGREKLYASGPSLVAVSKVAIDLL